MADALGRLSGGSGYPFKERSFFTDHYNPQVPLERGGAVVSAGYDFFHNMWGVPEEVQRRMQANPNMQAFDLVTFYKDVPLQIPSEFIDASILNARADVLLNTVAPALATESVLFEMHSSEFNQIAFQETAPLGLGPELTFRSATWRDKVTRWTMSYRIELALALSQGVGENLWLKHLAALASCAMLTVHQTIAYSLQRCAWENIIGENVKDIPTDLSKLMLTEERMFGIAADDPSAFLREILEYVNKIPGMDTVIMPENTTLYLNKIEGQSQTMMTQRVSRDVNTGEILTSFEDGARSIKTYTYGDRLIHFIEMPGFRVNMDDERVEQPLRTVVTVCQYYPVNPNVGAHDRPMLHDAVLNPILFEQTRTTGDEKVLNMREAYKHCMVWNIDSHDPEGRPYGAFSKRAEDYVRAKNQELSIRANIPWQFNMDTNRTHATDDINREDERYDCNHPHPEAILEQDSLLNMRGWRDMDPFLVYSPSEERYHLARRIGDHHLSLLPNAWLNKAAEAIVESAFHFHGLQVNHLLDRLYDLLDSIANAPWSTEWAAALINANIDNMTRINDDGTVTIVPSETPPERLANFPGAHPLQEWRGNRFGSLNLPRARPAGYNSDYPAGFDFGAGLQTLAKEAGNAGSDFRAAGEEAALVIADLEKYNRIMGEYVHTSDIANADLTPPWVHVSSPLTVLVDSIRPSPGPIFLALPPAASETRGGVRGKINYEEESARAGLTAYDRLIRNDTLQPDQYLTNYAKFLLVAAALGVDFAAGAMTDIVAEHKATFTNVPEGGQSYFQLLHKVVDYADRTVMREPSATVGADSLRVIYFLARSLNKLRSTSTPIEIQNVVKETKAMLDTFMNASASKTKEKEAAEKFRALLKEEPVLADGAIETARAMLSKIQSEEQRVINTRITAPSGVAGESYVDVVTALNNIDRTPNPSAERDRYLVILDNAGLGTPASRERTREPSIRTEVSFEGITSGGPYTYMRAPLMQSAQLMEYVYRQGPTRALAKPADPKTFYETPLDLLYIDYADATRRHRLSAKAHPATLSAMPFSNTFQLGATPSEGAFTSFKTKDVAEIKSKKTGGLSSGPKGLDINALLSGKASIGARGDLDGGYAEARSHLAKKSRPVTFGRDLSPEERDAQMKADMNAEFFGPWEARFYYLNNHIESPAVRAAFLGLIMAPNTLQVHLALSKIGQKLYNVLLFRPFIQHFMSSVLLLPAGSRTCLTAMGHSTIIPSKEDNGMCHVTAAFYHGFVRRQPLSIQMLPYAIPESFIGGMKLDFMTSPDHLTLAHPQKESMICALTPISESIYEPPLHLLNLPTYERPGVDHEPQYRKHSAAGWLEHCYGRNNLHDEEIKWRMRASYGLYADMSFCAHRGPLQYVDQVQGNTVTYKRVEGTGPRGQINKNVNGAHLAWQGGRLFPEASRLLTY
jgi:hypothetical protein